MRYETDHPRTWSELVTFLTQLESEQFRTFTRARGLDLETASAGETEALFTEWRLAGSPNGASFGHGCGSEPAHRASEYISLSTSCVGTARSSNVHQASQANDPVDADG